VVLALGGVAGVLGGLVTGVVLGGVVGLVAGGGGSILKTGGSETTGLGVLTTLGVCVAATVGVVGIVVLGLLEAVMLGFETVAGGVTGRGCTLGWVAKMVGVTDKAGRATGVMLATVALGRTTVGLIALTTGFGTTGRCAVTATGTGVMRVVVPAFAVAVGLATTVDGRGANGVLTTGVGIGAAVTGLEATTVGWATGAGVKTIGAPWRPESTTATAPALLRASGTNGLMILGATGFGAGLTVGLAVGVAGLAVGVAGLAAGLLAITGMFAVSSPPEEEVELVAGGLVGVALSGVDGVVLGAALTAVSGGVIGAVLTSASGTGTAGF
jgi:hypothetical protein